MAGRTVDQTRATVTAHKNLNEIILTLMRKKKITRYELAEAIGVDRKTIIAILKNQRSPKLDVVVKIFDYFGLKVVTIPIDRVCSVEFEKNH